MRALAGPIRSHTLASAWQSARMIEVEGLSKRYAELDAVSDLTFAVRPGEVLGLLGPNGAGKTTTLRCLAGVIPPTRGSVRIAGVDLLARPVEAKRALAFFSDEPHLFEHLTAEQHLKFIARLYQVDDAATRAPQLLEQFELVDKARALPRELSRGMKQKLAIACGLLHRPRAILFDEPLTGLDPAGIRAMKRTLRALAADGAALVLSSHLLGLLDEVCSHVLIVKGGRALANGSLEDVKRRYAESPDASLEDVFFSATGEAGAKA